MLYWVFLKDWKGRLKVLQRFGQRDANFDPSFPVDQKQVLLFLFFQNSNKLEKEQAAMCFCVSKHQIILHIFKLGRIVADEYRMEYSNIFSQITFF